MSSVLRSPESVISTSKLVSRGPTPTVLKNTNNSYYAPRFSPIMHQLTKFDKKSPYLVKLIICFFSKLYESQLSFYKVVFFFCNMMRLCARTICSH